MLRLLLFVFSLMSVFSSIATTYTLPDDATSLPGSCSASNSTVTCNSNLIFGDNDVIQLNPGSLPVQLTITGDFTFGSNFNANVGGAADDFSIQVDGNINPQNNAQIYTNITTDGNINSATGVTWVGNLSANGNVVLGANSSVTGNISSSNDVNIDSGTSVNGNINTAGTVTNNGTVSGYVNAAGVNDNSGGIQGEACDINNNIGACSDSQQLLHYTFEDANWTSSDPIADSSSNNNDGSALGSASILLPGTQVSCQALDVPSNTSDSEFDGLDTGLDINDDIGNTGSISFWYRSDVDWSSSSGRQLFDASNENPVGQSGDKHFYLALKSSELEFGIEDEGDLGLFVNLTNLTFTANEWVHIAATWDLGNEKISLTVTTSSVSASNSNTRSGISSQLGDMDTLYIGDNRSGYRVENSSQNSANGQFDDVRIYNFVQTSTQIQTDVDDVTTCPMDNLVYYQFEDEDWTSSDPIADSSSNNNDGSALGSASILLPDTQISCQALDVPHNTTSGNIDGLDTGLDVNSDIGDTGTISFWYKSNQSWDSGRSRQLFDAAKAGSDNKYFFLVLMFNNKLRFALEDSNDNDLLATTSSSYSFAADVWKHVAVTWDMTTLSMKIYIDGAEQSVNFVDEDGADSGLGELDTLYIGDNRSNYSVNRSTFRSADGQFDDVRIYNYVQTASQIQADLNSISLCRPLAQYEFEDSNWSTSDPVTDDLGLNNGNAVGSPNIVLPVPQTSCQAFSVPQNTSERTQDALDTGIDINTLGTDGTISFWYRSNESWNSGNARQLFDASTTVNNRYFYLVLKTNGALEFAMEDSDDDRLRGTSSTYNYAANEWVHIAVNWDLATETMQMFLNGSEVTVTMDNQGLTDTLADFDTLYIGDNRSTYFADNSDSSENSANGLFDSVRIYDHVQNASEVNVDYLDVSACGAVHHYRFEHDGSGLTCDTETITVRACEDSDCDTEYDDQAVTVSLEPSGWIGGDTVTFTGSAQLQLSITSVGAQTLNVVNESTDCTDTSDSSSSCEIEFVDAAFEFFAGSTGDTDFSDDEQIAETAFNGINLRAVRDNNGVCEAALNGTQSIAFGYDCQTPNTCAVPLGSIDGTGSSGEQSANVSITFDNNGEATLDPLNLTYADAGIISISAESSAINITKGSAQIEVVPAQLAVDTAEFISPITAGENKTLSISALGSAGTKLVSYQPNQVEMSINRTAPLAGENGQFRANNILVTSNNTFTNITGSGLNATNGVITLANSYYSEVGNISLDVQDNGYLGQTISADAVSIGTFIPAYLDISANTPSLMNSCDSTFTYIGETFGLLVMPELTVTAKNALGATTNNYSDSFWQLSPNIDSALVTYSDNNSADYASAASNEYVGDPPTISDNDNFDGAGKITVSNATFRFPKDSATAVDEFDASFNMTFSPAFLTDSDGVCYQTSYPNSCQSFTINSITGATLRYGRIRLENVFGPETEDLQMPLYAEYYNGSNWVLNSEDICTPIDWQAGQELTLNRENTSLPDSLTSDGILANGVPNSEDDLLFTSPGADNIGSVIVELDTDQANISYLDIDWDGDGDIDADDIARAIATFGQYRGNDRIIHWREQF